MDIVGMLRGMLRSDEPSPGTSSTAGLQPGPGSSLPTLNSR